MLSSDMATSIWVYSKPPPVPRRNGAAASSSLSSSSSWSSSPTAAVMAAASAAARPGLAALKDPPPPASVARPPQSWLPLPPFSSVEGALPYSSMLTSLAECASCARDVAAAAPDAAPGLPTASLAASGADTTRSWTSGSDDRTLSMGDQQPAGTEYAAGCGGLPPAGGGGSHGAGSRMSVRSRPGAIVLLLAAVTFIASGCGSDGLTKPVSTRGAATLTGGVLTGTAPGCWTCWGRPALVSHVQHACDIATLFAASLVRKGRMSLHAGHIDDAGHVPTWEAHRRWREPSRRRSYRGRCRFRWGCCR